MGQHPTIKLELHFKYLTYRTTFRVNKVQLLYTIEFYIHNIRILAKDENQFSRANIIMGQKDIGDDHLLRTF
jgi:hypothetical protein